jgi:hypothetical protein
MKPLTIREVYPTMSVNIIAAKRRSSGMVKNGFVKDPTAFSTRSLLKIGIKWMVINRKQELLAPVTGSFCLMRIFSDKPGPGRR